MEEEFKMSSTKWYYQDPATEARAGPVGVQFVRNLLLTQSIEEDTLVWTKGMTDWVSATLRERERERKRHLTALFLIVLLFQCIGADTEHSYLHDSSGERPEGVLHSRQRSK